MANSMISSFNPLSQQAEGMSARAQRYTAPLSSFVSRSNMAPVAEPAPPAAPPPVSDMAEVEPGVFTMRWDIGAKNLESQ